MPLSEDNQRRLDENERALHPDDPKFATGQSIERTWMRRTVAAGDAMLIGIVLLVVGLTTMQAVLVLGVIISVTGYLAMIGGAALITRRPEPDPSPFPAPVHGGTLRSSKKSEVRYANSRQTAWRTPNIAEAEMGSHPRSAQRCMSTAPV